MHQLVPNVQDFMTDAVRRTLAALLAAAAVFGVTEPCTLQNTSIYARGLALIAVIVLTAVSNNSSIAIAACLASAALALHWTTTCRQPMSAAAELSPLRKQPVGVKPDWSATGPAMMDQARLEGFTVGAPHDMRTDIQVRPGAEAMERHAASRRSEANRQMATGAAAGSHADEAGDVAAGAAELRSLTPPELLRAAQTNEL